MNDLVRRFEDCTLPAEDFHHERHVEVVWVYLHELPLAETFVRFSANLKRYATSLGKSMLYHETITWAYVILTHERWRRSPSADWEMFRRENPDLMVWKPSILDRYYRPGTLDTELARQVFVFPDRLDTYEELR